MLIPPTFPKHAPYTPPPISLHMQTSWKSIDLSRKQETFSCFWRRVIHLPPQIMPDPRSVFCSCVPLSAQEQWVSIWSLRWCKYSPLLQSADYLLEQGSEQTVLAEMISSHQSEYIHFTPTLQVENLYIPVFGNGKMQSSNRGPARRYSAYPLIFHLWGLWVTGVLAASHMVISINWWDNTRR